MSDNPPSVKKANKVICVDEEVFALIQEKCKTFGTPNNFLRHTFKLPPSACKVGRPPKEHKE